MRASTFFALTIAVLIGLGVAVAARVSGFFTPTKTVEPVPKKQEILVLAAGRNLFADDLIDSNSVRVRALKPEEMEAYQNSKDNFLPPLPAAVYLRIAARNIEADQLILRSSLKDMVKPEALNVRLLPQMRAVSLSLTKERSAGGLIQVGEWVDVVLTTQIDNQQGHKTVRTACIVPRVRVIAKRNTLWPVFAPMPEDKPVQFTLELNPYRAALLDYCLAKGQLTLAPLPATDQKILEGQRTTFLEKKGEVQPVHFLPPSNSEAEEEDGRVVAYNRGELVVSEHDLVRIFDLKPPSTPPPPMAMISVERVSGLQRFEPAVFNLDGSRATPPAKTGPRTTQANFSFEPPPGCASCAAARQKMGLPTRQKWILICDACARSTGLRGGISVPDSA